MGLQDTRVMSAVPAEDVIKSRKPPSQMTAPMTQQNGQTSAMMETLQAMKRSNGSAKTSDSVVNKTSTGHNSLEDNVFVDDVENHGVFPDVVDDDDEDIYDDDWESEEDDLKLSKALRHWMPDYVITPLPRQGHTLRQPVFSARLGRETTIRRAPSTESVDTQLSLFSCSSHGSRKTLEKKRRRLRRRKGIWAGNASELTSQSRSTSSSGSRWVELAKKRKGELDRFMMAQSHALAQGFNLMDESEAYQLCAPDEQRALYQCGKQNKLALAVDIRKASSLTSIPHQTEAKTRRRVASAGAKTSFGKPVDFQELRRQMMTNRLAALSALHRLRSSIRARSLHRSLSKQSLSSIGSNSDVFFSTTTPETSPLPLSEGGCSSGVHGDGGGAQTARSNVSMWKGDSQILAIDLKRGLTTKVKQRISVTTTALERVTGLGDNNEQRAAYTYHLAEFPAYINEDFALQPKIPQKIRISPHLSDVIKNDIRVRMGRPRYHEIRVEDLEMWNRGQTLDRAHRNLKVFNWLHSLKEDEFELTSMEQDIHDEPNDLDDVNVGRMIIIHAVDDPDVKPLFQHKKAYMQKYGAKNRHTKTPVTC